MSSCARVHLSRSPELITLTGRLCPKRSTVLLANSSCAHESASHSCMAACTESAVVNCGLRGGWVWDTGTGGGRGHVGAYDVLSGTEAVCGERGRGNCHSHRWAWGPAARYPRVYMLVPGKGEPTLHQLQNHGAWCIAYHEVDIHCMPCRDASQRRCDTCGGNTAQWPCCCRGVGAVLMHACVSVSRHVARMPPVVNNCVSRQPLTAAHGHHEQAWQRQLVGGWWLFVCGQRHTVWPAPHSASCLVLHCQGTTRREPAGRNAGRVRALAFWCVLLCRTLMCGHVGGLIVFIPNASLRVGFCRAPL